ncbi:hypothetical protein [Streptomyces sp. NBC_00557]|uniref:hypothetical protein n=1 Tax=Streptomyces sp. NBC_00557 TaxID=2975776 RepID=UPI002E822174|nr:hypothetical protein [Streptomyces sp. NBC_00557]WUC33717.1 hypothetical protein OG956_05575 [Streptomyces sp. NBC_00557]
MTYRTVQPLADAAAPEELLSGPWCNRTSVVTEYKPYLLHCPESLAETETLQLETVRAHCPDLDATTRHVRSFAAMLTDRQGQRLPNWLDSAYGHGGT